MASGSIEIRSELQKSPVADEVSALIAVIRPILQGLLYGLKAEAVSEVGGYSKVRLHMLPRLYRPGDGDCGICYEYAVHDAIRRRDPLIQERIEDALKQCKVPGHALESILFGAEKTGAIQLIETATKVLTEDSRVLTGEQAQPPKLKAYINRLAAAFRRPSTRYSLPSSISGLWKADLFIGCTDSDRWVGTSVKINPTQLEGAKGLRVGIVPTSQGRSDRIRKDVMKNIIICPLPYDASFMELFYNGWHLIQQFIAADANVPKEVNLPSPPHRQVCKLLVDRKKFPIVDVIEAIKPLSQPELLKTEIDDKSVILTRNEEVITNTVIAPISQNPES